MRNPIDFTPPEHYREMDEMAKYQRKLIYRMLLLDIALFALWAAVMMTIVVLFLNALKAS